MVCISPIFLLIFVGAGLTWW